MVILHVDDTIHVENVVKLVKTKASPPSNRSLHNSENESKSKNRPTNKPN